MTSSERPERPERPVVPTPPTTGVAAVDRVLAGLQGLEQLPVAARVSAFEEAHSGLRRALDGHDDEGGADGAAHGSLRVDTAAAHTAGPGVQPGPA